jgi:DNA-binding NtrC family response regulator
VSVNQSGPRVLVVDDEQLIRWSLRECLERAGCRVLDAADARGALLQAPRADVVVVDRRLPDGDGLAVAATLHRERPRRPVILMTACDSAEVDFDAARAGVEAVFQKPFELDEIVCVILECAPPQRA